MNRGILVLTTVLVAACGGRPSLEPAPGAQPAPGGGYAGFTDGVMVTADPDAWRGVPRRLDTVTPVLVTIQNDGTTPVRIRYNEFTLVAPDGRRYAAIPPFQVRGTEVEYISDLEYSGFYVAPWYSRYYPRIRPFRGYPYTFDPVYYDRYYPRFVELALPTGDMIQKALPEGVLEPGGRVSGFLYFENVSGDVPSVDFRAELVNAATGEPFGAVNIPFLVD